MVGLFGSLTLPNFVCEIFFFSPLGGNKVFVLKIDISHIYQPIGAIFYRIVGLDRCFSCAKFRLFALFHLGDNGKKFKAIPFRL